MEYEDLIGEEDDSKFESMILELRADREADKNRKIEWEKNAPERKRIHEERMLNDPMYRRMQEILIGSASILGNMLPMVYNNNSIRCDVINIKKPARYIGKDGA